MNTLQELRRTVAAHADSAPDTTLHLRTGAVRGRVRRVRRRRVAVGAGAVVAVLAMVGITVPTADRDGAPPVASVVAGVDLPRYIEVLGFPHRLSRTAELDADSLRLGRSDAPRVVRLAGSGLGEGSATLLVDDVAVARLRGAERMAAPVAIDRAEATLRVRLDGTPPGARSGVAVYAATGELAAGVVDPSGRTVFRDELAGQPLLGAVFADPGAASADVAIDPPPDLAPFDFDTPGAPRVRAVLHCTGPRVPEGLMVRVDLDGEPGIGAGCDGALPTPTPDATTGTSGVFGAEVEPDVPHQARVSLFRTGPGGRSVELGEGEVPDGLIFGVGLYRAEVMTVGLGTDADLTVEGLGRTWRLSPAEVLPGPGRTATPERATEIPSGATDVLLHHVSRGVRQVRWTGALDRGESGLVLGDVSSGGDVGLLPAGDVYRVEMAEAAPDAEAIWLVYRPE